MSEVVLDASAVLALLNDEPGALIVQQSLHRAAVSSVNLSEVIAKLADVGMPPDEIRDALTVLGLEICPFDEHQAFAAGLLRPATRSLGLSLGDRACLALGQTLDRAVLTADKSWQALSAEMAITLIR